MSKCIALFSGGLDSLSYLAQYLPNWEIIAITFDYSEQSKKEVEVAKPIISELVRQDYIISHRVFDLQPVKWLFPDRPLAPEYHPSSVLPFRNSVFLTLASAYAKTMGAARIIIGSHTDDGENWSPMGIPKNPECTKDYLMQLEELLDRGCLKWDAGRMEIWSPARTGLSKASNLKRGYDVLGELIFKTWSCWTGKDKHCGFCLSCRERKKAFKSAKIADNTEYEI